MTPPIPHEVSLGGVYLSPLLVAGTAGVLLALVTARMLRRYRMSHHFFYPPLVTLALMVLYTVLIGTFLIGV